MARGNGKVTLKLQTTDVNEPRTSWNVVADLPGRENSKEMVVVGCHYDGHDISQGAHDPASGMVSVIEAARVLSTYAADSLKHTVRFIAFGTEEIGLTGAFRYVDAHASELDNIRFMLNMDAAGGASRKVSSSIIGTRWDLSLTRRASRCTPKCRLDKRCILTPTIFHSFSRVCLQAISVTQRHLPEVEGSVTPLMIR